jgi:hypothetical protein
MKDLRKVNLALLRKSNSDQEPVLLKDLYQDDQNEDPTSTLSKLFIDSCFHFLFPHFPSSPFLLTPSPLSLPSNIY